MVSYTQKRAYESEKVMEFLQSREWGLMILDGEGEGSRPLSGGRRGPDCMVYLHCICVASEVQTIPADKFRRVLSGT